MNAIRNPARYVLDFRRMDSWVHMHGIQAAARDLKDLKAYAVQTEFTVLNVKPEHPHKLQNEQLQDHRQDEAHSVEG